MFYIPWMNGAYCLFVLVHPNSFSIPLSLAQGTAMTFHKRKSMLLSADLASAILWQSKFSVTNRQTTPLMSKFINFLRIESSPDSQHSVHRRWFRIIWQWRRSNHWPIRSQGTRISANHSQICGSKGCWEQTAAEQLRGHQKRYGFCL